MFIPRFSWPLSFTHMMTMINCGILIDCGYTWKRSRKGARTAFPRALWERVNDQMVIQTGCGFCSWKLITDNKDTLPFSLIRAFVSVCACVCCPDSRRLAPLFVLGLWRLADVDTLRLQEVPRDQMESQGTVQTEIRHPPVIGQEVICWAGQLWRVQRDGLALAEKGKEVLLEDMARDVRSGRQTELVRYKHTHTKKNRKLGYVSLTMNCLLSCLSYMAVFRDTWQMIEPYVLRLRNFNNTWLKKQKKTVTFNYFWLCQRLFMCTT